MRAKDAHNTYSIEWEGHFWAKLNKNKIVFWHQGWTCNITGTQFHAFLPSCCVFVFVKHLSYVHKLEACHRFLLILLRWHGTSILSRIHYDASHTRATIFMYSCQRKMHQSNQRWVIYACYTSDLTFYQLFLAKTFVTLPLLNDNGGGNKVQMRFLKINFNLTNEYEWNIFDPDKPHARTYAKRDMLA